MNPHRLFEVMGWLQISLACTLGFALAGVAAGQLFPVGERLAVFIVMSSIGFILGSIWATRIWRKYGTVNWLSRIRRVS
jgi:hypothetical protein